MSCGSEGRDWWMKEGGAFLRCWHFHSTGLVELGEHHERLQKSLRSSGCTRWASIAVRWAGHMSLPNYHRDSLAVTCGEWGWNQPLCRRDPGSGRAGSHQAFGFTWQSSYSASQSPVQVWRVVRVDRKGDRKRGTNLTASWIFPAILLGKTIYINYNEKWQKE